ncbi:sulfotransferase family protein [Nonomuraea sp. NPDC050451]|uniref:sulfotransferase family protein n=1 Tax=Nonomuraea sp. NPDC050451 TaxID=3364364 RepID=UPI00378B9A9D
MNVLDIIGAGLPRTGTSSMQAALQRLGFAPCYHMMEIFRHPDHVPRWLAVAAGKVTTRRDWDQVFAGYRATQDWPASHYWRELADTYPQAKVVLTVREPDAWYRSIRMLFSLEPDNLRLEDLPQPVREVLTEKMRLHPLLESIQQALFGPQHRRGAGLPDKDLVVRAFHQHCAAVRAHLPAERLLVFDVRQGWEPLCAFLGVPVPAGEPFPHLNDAASMQDLIRRMLAGDLTGTVFQPGDG